jgi:alpha-glucosidase
MCEIGLPIVRALVMDCPTDTTAYDVDNQFMFGESVMIAPVENESSREVYLPEGRWTDFWTGEVYDGGCKITYDTPLERLPVFVKAGGIVPMAPAMAYVGEKPIDEIELYVYPGWGSFTLFDDDGVMTDYQRGRYTAVTVHLSDSSVEIDGPEGNYDNGLRAFPVISHDNRGRRKLAEVPYGRRAAVPID